MSIKTNHDPASETLANEEKNASKPEWLRKLEEESWQAELALSGAAFFAALQLPKLFDWLEAKLMLNAEDFTLSQFEALVPVIYIVTISFPALFIFHLVIRALWIGLVGLNFAFPDGFQFNDRYSEDYQQKMIQDYGDLDGYIQKVDKLASSIFGIGFGLSLTFLNITIVVGIMILFASLLNSLPAPWNLSRYIVAVVLAGCLLLSFLITYSHHPKIHSHPLVLKYQYPIIKKYSKAAMPFGHRYVNTTVNLFSFNNFSIKNFWITMFYCVVGGFLMGVYMGATQQFQYMASERYHKAAQDSTQIFPYNYADNEFSGVYVAPLIPTMELAKKQIFSCWIPLPARDIEHLEDNCTLPEVDGNLSLRERRKAKKQRVFQCTYEYIDLKINGRNYPNFSLKQEYITNEAGRQFGVRALIQQPDLQVGENVLTVTTRYPHPDTGEPRQAYITFYYTPLYAPSNNGQQM